MPSRAYWYSDHPSACACKRCNDRRLEHLKSSPWMPHNLKLTIARLMRILATLFPILGWLLIILGFIDFGVSWGLHFYLIGWPFSAFVAGISGSVLLRFGRQIEKDSQSGSSLKLIRSYLFVFVGFIIFGFFVWSIVNTSGLLGDHGLYPDHFANKYYTSGTEYLNQEQYSQAIEDFNEAIRISPQYANAYHNRAYALNKLDQYERAIEDYTEAISLDPQYDNAGNLETNLANVYYNRGIAYRNLGQHEQAILDFDEYIRLDPEDAGAYFNRAYSYYELDQPERAIEDYSEAIRLDPEVGDAYYNRGIAYRNLGQQKIADRDFARAKELGVE